MFGAAKEPMEERSHRFLRGTEVVFLGCGDAWLARLGTPHIPTSHTG